MARAFLQQHTNIFYTIHVLIPLTGIYFFVTGKASDCVKRDILPQKLNFYAIPTHIGAFQSMQFLRVPYLIPVFSHIHEWSTSTLNPTVQTYPIR